MHERIAIGITVLFAAASQAAEPTVPQNAKPAAPVTAPAAPRAPLKLRVGDVRKYMMPRDFQAVVKAPEPDSTIVVEGDRPAPELKSTQPLPTGFGALYSLFRHPTNAWRMFLPDPNAAAFGPAGPVPKLDRMGPMNGETARIR